MSAKKNAPKSETKKTEAKPIVPTLKKLLALVNSDERPRGLKVAKNEAGAYVFSYGPKSAPVAVVASGDELVAGLLKLLGLKLS
jgi:hypothetical protein